jgi:hypothetical protein
VVKKKEERDKMKLGKLILLLFAATIMSMGITFYFYTHYIIQEILTVEAHVEVNDYVGFNLDTDKLYFGTVFPGGASERAIYVSYYKKEPAYVTVSVTGPIADWIEPKPDRFLIYNETREVMFRITPPKDAVLGNHTSTIRFFFKRI